MRELRERIEQLETDLRAARAARAAPSDSGEARYPVRLPGERTRSGTSATEARTCRRGGRREIGFWPDRLKTINVNPRECSVNLVNSNVPPVIWAMWAM